MMAKQRKSRWASVDPDMHPERIPPTGGVYAVFAGRKLLYVGETENLHKRIVWGHCIRCTGYSGWITTPWGEFQHVSVRFRVSRKYGEWAMAERRLIRRLQPQFNRRGVAPCHT